MGGLWLGRVKIYFDFADWWIGLYIGPNHLYFCCLTLVCRVPRQRRSP
jgi:hypothetical protein